MAENITLTAEARTEFGKGAARRTRRANKIPAVLYGHGTDPVHMSLPSLEFARVLRAHGTNAVLTITVDSVKHLALVKTIVVHPLRNYIEHADLLVIRRGEKVTIDVRIVVVGDAEGGTMVTQETNTLQVEADVMSIPEQVEVSVEGAAVGTMITAGDITLPEGVNLIAGPDTLIVNVVAAPSASDMETEAEAGGAGVAQEPAAEAAAEKSES